MTKEISIKIEGEKENNKKREKRKKKIREVSKNTNINMCTPCNVYSCE